MMKRVLIKDGFVGLVFKNGNYQRHLEAGKYWLGFGENVIVYNLFREFIPSVELEVLLKNVELKSRLNIVEVGEGEIVLQFEKKVMKEILTTGTYAFWKNGPEYTFKTIDLTGTEMVTDMEKFLREKVEMMRYIRVFVVEAFEKGLLFVDGEFKGVLAPGTYYFWKNSTPVSVLRVETRQQQMEISGQEILTRDKAALRVNFYVHYAVRDVEKAVVESKNYKDQLYMLMQFGLREFIGILTLDELLEKKEEVGQYILKSFKPKAVELGVELISAGIRDVILPGEVKEIMNQVLVAQKRAQANIITRREETASTRSLLNTAKLMEDNDMLFKLKEMEYVEKIAEKIGEITVNGSGNAIEQLREIFTVNRK